MTTTPSGLQYEDTVIGTGATAEAGKKVKVHYTGWLYNDGVQGAKFDSSKDRGQPFEFSLGAGQVIKGWTRACRAWRSAARAVWSSRRRWATARAARAA